MSQTPKVKVFRALTVALGLLVLTLLVAAIAHVPVSSLADGGTSTDRPASTEPGGADGVRLGMHVRSLGPVDADAETFSAAFDLWLVGDAPFDPATLLFLDATSPVRLGEPTASRAAGGQQYRLYRTEGTFRYRPSAADLVDGRLHLRIVVVDAQGTTAQRAIMPDTRAADPLPERLSRRVFTTDGEWAVEQARLEVRDVALPTLGDPTFPETSSRHAGVAAEFVLQAPPDLAQLLQRLVPDWLALPTLFGTIAVLACMPLLARRDPNAGTWRLLSIVFASTLLLAAAEQAFGTFLALDLRPAVVRIVMNGFAGACLAVAAVWLIALVPVLVWRPMERRTGTPPSTLERALVNAVIVLGLLLYFLVKALHLSAASIGAASGVLTIVLGIALQNIILDLFSGILLNLEKPFRLLNWVTVSTGGAPVHGQVRNMNWRTTQLQTRDNDIVSIPNSVMARSTVNNHATPSRATRWKLEFVLDPKANTHLARRVMREAVMRSVEQGLILDQPPPNVVVREAEDYGVRYRVLFYLDLNITPDLPAQNSVMENVLEALDGAGIKLAFRNHGLLMQPDGTIPATTAAMPAVTRLSVVKPQAAQQAKAADAILTLDEIVRIKASWRTASTLGDTVAALFYERLFEIAPHLRPLFRSDQKTQRTKLLAMLGMLVKSLNNPDAVLTALADLGLRHNGYGVKPADYDAVGAALLWTLQRGLGDAFDASTRAAWTKLYGAIAGVMIKASGQKVA